MLQKLTYAPIKGFALASTAEVLKAKVLMTRSSFDLMFSQLEKSPVNVFRTKHHRRGNSSHTENKYEVTELFYSL